MRNDNRQIRNLLSNLDNIYVPIIGTKSNDGIISGAWVLLMSQSSGEMLIKQVSEMISDNIQLMRMVITDDMHVVYIDPDVKVIRRVRRRIEGKK